MVTTQVVLIIRISFLSSIRKLFKLNLNKLVIFLTLFLFSCSNHIIKAEEVKPENLKCGSSIAVGFFQKYGIFTPKNKDFNYKLRFINENLNKDDFNFLYISKPIGGGYVLKVEKIVKKRNKHELYFKELKPAEGSSNIAAITATYCLLKIKNLNKFKVYIDSK